MAGIIVVDRIESDASYASSINVASPLIIANSSTFTSNMTLTKATPYLYITSTGGTNQNLWMKDNANNTFAIESQPTAQGGVFLSNRTAAAPIYVRSANTGGTLVTSAILNQFGIGLGDSTPQSGMGIRFPATQSTSSDANTLDDYEEGTWTPVMATGSTQPTFTYTNRGGTYVKIGRQVIAWFYADVNVTSAGSAQAALEPSSLPFTPRGDSRTNSSSSRGGFVTSNPQSLNNVVLRWNNNNPASADALYFTTLTGGSTTSGLATGVYAGYVIYEAD